jgi:hypothetical protein
MDGLYNDKKSGLIPDSLFKRQIQKYERERIERIKATKEIKNHLDNIKPANNGASWIKLIKKYANAETFNREAFLLLIDKIIVNNAKYIDGQRICDLKIFYNFVGDVSRFTHDTDMSREVSPYEL